MIIQEPYISTTASKPLIKIYSDKGFLIQSKGVVYKEAIITKEEDINDFTETFIGIPEPIANENFIYNTFIGPKRNITQNQIQEARALLNKAFKSLTDEEAYTIKFLFEEWQYNKNYQSGERVLYNNELYNIINSLTSTLTPEDDKVNYQKTNRPLDLIDEWNDADNKVYNIGDKVRIGDYIYSSLVDNNTWSPKDFPAVWQLI